MGPESDNLKSEIKPAEPAGCPLSRAEQTRNLLVFASCKGLIYLSAPVLYIGVQTPLCNWLGAPITVSNIPKAGYLAMTVAPVFFAWYWPYISYLKPSLVGCFSLAAAVLALLAAVLIAPLPAQVKIAVVILQAVVCGAALPTADALIWEMLGRGVAESRRGQTLSLAFGIGPILAAISSLGSQLVLNDKLRTHWLPTLEHPWTFAILFALAAPLMLLAAYLCSRCVVPLPDREVVREPFVRGVFGGSREFLTDRTLLTATVVTILVYSGNMIDPNMSLYTKAALGEAPEQYAGLQLFLRFSFKSVAGLLLGWMIARTNPKAGLMVTALTFLAAVVWAMLATGPWYLAAFGIYGAGELVGVYAPNYILSASRKAQLRRNMAFVTMMMAPAAPAGYLFGAVAEHYGTTYDPAVGFQASFAVCAGLILTGILIALFLLPARPRPSPED